MEPGPLIGLRLRDRLSTGVPPSRLKGTSSILYIYAQLTVPPEAADGSSQRSHGGIHSTPRGLDPRSFSGTTSLP